MEKPQKIIEAFDECLTYIFGPSFARDNPHKSDMETAKRWAKDGLSVIVATMVFYDRMTYLHERFLRVQDKRDRSLIPHSLKLFDENIEAALRRQKGETVDLWEAELSRWRARCKFWVKNHLSWRESMWGPAPFENGTRVPGAILREIEKHKPAA